MLIASALPHEGEREAALAIVPWQGDARDLAGALVGTLRHQTVDLIDIALGTVHARAALVALHEGIDATLQAAMELADSVANERYFAREKVLDPLGGGEPLTLDQGLTQMRRRTVRIPIEDAAIRLAAAGNHFVNAHLRFAWEANAATRSEVRACGFDPDRQRRFEWASLEQFANGLDGLGKQAHAVLPAFALAGAYSAYRTDPSVVAARDLRDAVVHRERPSYREAPSFGRRSLWEGGFKVTFPPPADAEDPEAPTIAERREVVSQAGSAAVRYAQAIWSLMLRWLATVGVVITRQPGQVTVRVDVQPGSTGPRLPREQRDPGPFLTAAGVEGLGAGP